MPSKSQPFPKPAPWLPLPAPPPSSCPPPARKLPSRPSRAFFSGTFPVPSKLLLCICPLLLFVLRLRLRTLEEHCLYLLSGALGVMTRDERRLHLP